LLRDAADPARHHRRTGGQRLEHTARKRVRARRMHVELGGPEPLRHLFGRDGWISEDGHLDTLETLERSLQCRVVLELVRPTPPPVRGQSLTGSARPPRPARPTPDRRPPPAPNSPRSPPFGIPPRRTAACDRTERSTISISHLDGVTAVSSSPV